MLFENRTHAGKLIGELLKEKLEDKSNTIILAIPRGGAEIAYNMAKVLHIPFSLIIVRKLGIPWNEEAAFGSVDPDGITYIDEAVVRYARISKEEIERVKLKELKKRVFCFYKAKEGSFAVGMFYKDFKQLSDEEVMEIIEKAKEEGLFFQNRS